MKPALLLVDLQNDFLNADGLQPAAETIVAAAAVLLAGCRERNIPVFHVWTTIHRNHDRRLPHWKKSNRWHCVTGTAGHATPEALRPREGEVIIHKTGFNAFANPELEATLRRLGCDAVLVSGVHLHTCVRTAAAESFERQLEVWIAEDGAGSNDPIYAAATRRWLAERGTRLAPAGVLLAQMDGTTAAGLIHRSPRETAKVLFGIPIAGADEIARATQAARSVWHGWRRTASSLRCAALEKVSKRLEDAAPELAWQMAIEIGKPVAHGLEEVRRAAANIRDVIRRAAAFEFQKREPAGLIRHEALGVIALISPWNNPVAIPLGKIAPALAYGNTVVWKPAPAATNLAHHLLRLCREAGLPNDVLRLVTGDAASAQRLAADANIAAATLTGSAQAGYAIQEICARRGVPLQAELSGNNAAIVADDADLAHAAEQIAWGAFGFAGQRCTANRRAIVGHGRFEAFLDALKSAAEQLAWGEPLESNTDIGPVIHTAKRDEQTALIQSAQASGAANRVELLGTTLTKESWFGRGAYAQPAIVACDRPEHRLVQEETMSPLLVVQRAEDFDQALALCNGVRHGLAAALFSSAADLQREFLSEARAGILKLNSSTAGVDVSLPFGGWKSSGLGPPEHGEGDRLFYTRLQAVYGADGFQA